MAVGKSSKDNYKKGKLSPDRIKRLEDIGFTWDMFDEQFEKGFQETLKYKKSTGNPNAPVNTGQLKVSFLVNGKVVKRTITRKEIYLKIG